MTGGSPALPRSLGVTASRNTAFVGTSMPGSSRSRNWPRLYSPTSSARAPGPGRIRQGVRDIDLVERESVDDRTHATAALEADLVQDDALARIEAHPKAPPLPAHLAAANREAGPLGLRHDKRRERRPRAAGSIRRGAVHGPPAGVLHVDHLHPVGVDRDQHTLDRTVVGVRQIAGEEGEGAQKPHAGGRHRQVQLARRPDVEEDVVRVDAAASHRPAPAGIARVRRRRQTRTRRRRRPAGHRGARRTNAVAPRAGQRRPRRACWRPGRRPGRTLRAGTAGRATSAGPRPSAAPGGPRSGRTP